MHGEHTLLKLDLRSAHIFGTIQGSGSKDLILIRLIVKQQQNKLIDFE